MYRSTHVYVQKYTYFPMFDLFSISTTSSWPSLYSSDFMAYFIYFSLVSLPIHVVFYGAHYWWPILQTYLIFVRQVILYMWTFKMTFFCTHTSQCYRNSYKSHLFMTLFVH